jgi:hypothetical protein
VGPHALASHHISAANTKTTTTSTMRGRLRGQRTHRLGRVDDVVRPGGRPAPVADDVITAIRRAERDGLFDAAAGCRLTEGEASPLDVRFTGLVAPVIENDGNF